MRYILLLAIGLAYFISTAQAQSSNETSSNETEPQPFITCPPEPTCPPVQECTCPPVTECPTTESTRTRGRTRTRGPGGRTDTRRGRTNKTRTDGPGGRTGRTNRTRTDTGRTRTRPGRTNRRRPDTGRTRTRPGRTGRTNRTRTDTGRTRTGTRAGKTKRTRTGPRRTRTRPSDCTPRLPPGCEDFVTTTGPVIFTTGTTQMAISTSRESTTPPSQGTTESPSTSPPHAGTTTSSSPTPLPGTTQLPPSNITACSSSVIDASGQREIPVIALQFTVSQNPYIFAREATDFAEVISLLASESAGVDQVTASVLGISVQKNGLSSVIVAVSYNTTANKSIQSSSGIVELIYEHLDQLGVYYQVTDMKAMKMTAQNYGPVPSDSINPEPTNMDLSASAVATIILSTLALTGILGVLVILMVKLSSGFMQRSNENQPLLNDRRVGSPFTVIWRKKSNTAIF